MQHRVEDVANKSRARRFFPAIPLFACLLLPNCGPRPDERRESIYDLKAEPTRENVQQIREWLDDSDRNVRATALNALIGLEVADAAELALAALADSDGFVRATAAKLLGDLGDPAFVQPLGRLLRDDSDAIARLRSAESLARIGGADALTVLAVGLSDPMQQVRMTVVEGIGKLDPAFARVDLVRLLHEDAVWEVRAQAAHALGLSGAPEVVADLEAATEDPNEFVRTAAENALHLHERVQGLRSGTELEKGQSGVY